MKKLLTAAAVALGMSLPMSAQTSYKPVELDALQVEEVFPFLTPEHFEDEINYDKYEEEGAVVSKGVPD